MSMTNLDAILVAVFPGYAEDFARKSHKNQQVGLTVVAGFRDLLYISLMSTALSYKVVKTVEPHQSLKRNVFKTSGVITGAITVIAATQLSKATKVWQREHNALVRNEKK